MELLDAFHDAAPVNRRQCVTHVQIFVKGVRRRRKRSPKAFPTWRFLLPLPIRTTHMTPVGRKFSKERIGWNNAKTRAEVQRRSARKGRRNIRRKFERESALCRGVQINYARAAYVSNNHNTVIVPHCFKDVHCPRRIRYKDSKALRGLRANAAVTSITKNWVERRVSNLRHSVG
jgi:hypothetical protein